MQKKNILMEEVSVWRLMGINGAAFGHEISACVAYTYVPPLLLKAGFSETSMAVIMGIAPFLALFTIPSIGKWSDGCSSLLGRRRPFILAISLFLLCSLLVIPYADAICLFFGFRSTSLLHSLLLAAGVVMMDYASLVAFNPCEALVCDLLQEDNGNVCASSQESARRFAIYSAMISLGSCLGYLVTAIHWETLGIRLGNQEQTAFLIVIVLLTCSVTSTMWLAQEIPRPLDGSSGQIVNRRLADPKRMLQRFVSFFRTTGSMLKLLLILPWKIVSMPLRLWMEFRRIPPMLRQLFVSTFVSWLAINCQGLFFTDYVGQAVYGGNPNAASQTIPALRYDQGVRRGCLGLFLHGVLACAYSGLAQDKITSRVGLRGTYVLGLALYSVSMVATLLNSSPDSVTFWSLVSGTGFAVVTTIPPCLVALYSGDQNLPHSTEMQLQPEENKADDGDRGFGRDIAVLECAFCLSRILLASLMGAAVDWTGLVHCYIIAAAAFGFIACLLAWRIVYFKPASTCCTDSNHLLEHKDVNSIDMII